MDLESINILLESPEPADRIAGLKMIQDGAARLPDEYIMRAERLILDPDNNCRWQAFIAIGEFIQRAAPLVWGIVIKYGASPDEDMRDATATVLLEHLLDYEFEEYFALTRKEIDAGNAMLLDTLQRCWPLDNSEEQWREVVAYLQAKGIPPILPWEVKQNG